jgi:hypothetical protein
MAERRITTSMRMASVIVLSAVVASCGGRDSPSGSNPETAVAPRAEPSPGPASSTSDAGVAPQASPSARCLPVVAAECGCVYSCAAGTETSPGRWQVRHPFWTEPLVARIDRWCVDGQCTEAFFGEIVCSGICPPRPADATCHFENDVCVGTAPTP